MTTQIHENIYTKGRSQLKQYTLTDNDNCISLWTVNELISIYALQGISSRKWRTIDSDYQGQPRNKDGWVALTIRLFDLGKLKWWPDNRDKDILYVKMDNKLPELYKELRADEARVTKEHEIQAQIDKDMELAKQLFEKEEKKSNLKRKREDDVSNFKVVAADPIRDFSSSSSGSSDDEQYCPACREPYHGTNAVCNTCSTKDLPENYCCDCGDPVYRDLDPETGTVFCNGCEKSSDVLVPDTQPYPPSPLKIAKAEPGLPSPAKKLKTLQDSAVIDLTCDDDDIVITPHKDDVMKIDFTDEDINAIKSTKNARCPFTYKEFDDSSITHTAKCGCLYSIDGWNEFIKGPTKLNDQIIKEKDTDRRKRLRKRQKNGIVNRCACCGKPNII